MVDTIRTEADLLDNLFQDGQTGGISANDVRDFVVSVPTLASAGGTGLIEIASHDLSAGSISEVITDITGFDYVLITYQDVDTTSSTTVRAEMGVGPSTWRTGATDYQYSYFNGGLLPRVLRG